MDVTKETFLNSLKANYNYPDSFFEQVYECTPNIQDALYFVEYYSSETMYGEDVEGTVEDYFGDFKQIANLGY